MFPTLIDMSMRYEGPSSPKELQERMISLLHDSVRSHEGQTQINMSNIIARLDDEGLIDRLNVEPEIRVTNFLDDGEHEVRYLNPAEATKQELAIYGTQDPAVVQNDYLIKLKRLDSDAPIPGRGRLILGGNDPSRREMLPYEAVLDVPQDDVHHFVLRSSMEYQYIHHDWETAWVTTRDYDPSLEFDEGTIWIPPNNRPYLRHMMVRKYENTR